MKRERLKYVSIFLIVSAVLVGGWYAAYRFLTAPEEPYIHTEFTPEEASMVFDAVQWPQREDIALKALVYYPYWRDPFMTAYFSINKNSLEGYIKTLGSYSRMTVAPDSSETTLSLQGNSYSALQKWGASDSDKTFWVYDLGGDNTYIIELYFTSPSIDFTNFAANRPYTTSTSSSPLTTSAVIKPPSTPSFVRWAADMMSLFPYI